MKRLFVAIGLILASVAVSNAVDEGINLGVARLHLWGELSGTYDDNVRLVVGDGEIQDRTIFTEEKDVTGESQTESDIYYELTLGGRLYRETDSFLAGLSLAYLNRTYTDFSDLDNDSYIQEAELLFGEREVDTFTLGFKEAYRKVFDYENVAYPDDFTNPDTQSLFLSEDRTERVSRELIDLGAVLTWRITEKLASDYSLGYGSIEYDTEFLYDWSDIKGQAEFDYKVTDKTALLLTGQYGMQESDSLENEPDYYVLRGGFLNRSTDKLTFKGGVGAGRYDRFSEKEGLPGSVSSVEDGVKDESGGSVDYLSYDIAGDWDLSQRTKLQIIGRNAVQPAAQYNDNVKIVSVASVGLSRRILEDFRLAGTISYRNDDYQDLVEIDTNEYIDQEDTIWGGHLRLGYEPQDGYLNVYVAASYEDRTTNIPNEDYDQLRLSIGLKLKI